MNNLINGFINTLMEDIHLTECEQDINCGYAVTEADRATIGEFIEEIVKAFPDIDDTESNGSDLYIGCIYDSYNTPLRGSDIVGYCEIDIMDDYFYLRLSLEHGHMYTVGEF